MGRMRRAPISLALLALSLAALQAAGPGNRNDFQGRRVLVIGVDGLRSDALRESREAPHLRQLMARGVLTWDAQAGGELGGATQQPTISGPSWATILSGKYLPDHGVPNNVTGPYGTAGNYHPEKAPHFAKYLKQTHPTAQVASIVSWGWIEDYFNAPQTEFLDFHAKAEGSDYPGRDSNVRDQAVEHLAHHDPDILFLHFDQVDGAGHKDGFSTTVPSYLEAITRLDGLIGDVLAAIERRPSYLQEDWLVIVTSDHGGKGRAHGSQDPEVRTVPMIVAGKNVAQGRIETSSPGLHVVAATAFAFLGVPVDPAWNLEPGTFGVPPYTDTTVESGAVTVRWTRHPRLAAVKSIDIARDGQALACLPASAMEFTDTPPADGEEHRYAIRFQGIGDERIASVTVLPPPDLESDLVLHLPFDGDATDRSGRDHHAIATAPAYIPEGKSGQAATLNAASSFSLGTPDDLKFGADTDFTVSFWVRSESPWTRDPSFISNKAWANGSTPGWIIAGAPASQAWQWNLRGATDLPRIDFDPSPDTATIADPQWHLITVSHRRSKAAMFYHDRREIGRLAIAGAGDIDTPHPIRIGCDGTGALAFDTDVWIDDLRIWRRALHAGEVAALHDNGAR
jgi:hypothetical protein